MTTVQLLVDGAWLDITALDKVYTRNPITITSGRANEAARVEASRCTLTLDNRDGELSPRNPNSPYFKKIGRNTQIRVRQPVSPGLRLDGTANSYASTPDAAALDITGDIDLRAELTLDGATGTHCVMSKGPNGGPQLSYQLLIGYTGGVPHLTFRWSADGTTTLFVDHDVPELVVEQRLAVRATMDVNDGGGNRVIRFYTAAAIAGPWTQHGVTHTVAGVTSIFSGTAPLEVGRQGVTDRFVGTIYAVRVLNGIDGPEVANPDFQARPLGAAAFADAAGRTWTLAAAAVIGLALETRFTGEVASFPQDWTPDAGTGDGSGDVYVPIEAAGILRRLGQGKAPAASAIREYLQSTGPDKYLPLDQSAGSQDLYVQTRSSFTKGGGDLGPDMPPGLRLNTTAGGYLYTIFSQPAGPTEFTLDWLYKATQLGTLIFTVWTEQGGIYDRFRVMLRGDAVNDDVAVTTEFDYLNSGAVTQVNSPALDAITDGDLHHVRFVLDQNGANVDYTVYIDGVSVLTSTHAAYTLKRAWELTIDYTPTTTNYVALGHIVAWFDSAPAVAVAADAVLHSRSGETAGRRIERMCAQVGIPFRAIGDLDGTAIMGPQGQKPPLDVITECAETDLGLLYEDRTRLGLVYRTRDDLYNQPPVATLDYTAGLFSKTPAPVDDDQLTRNDVTVQRPNGGAYRAVLESGPLSVLDPPDGVGTYDTETTVNVVTDAALPDQAAWRLHLGTLDEARYPVLAFPLHAPSFTQDPAARLLARSVALLEPGDRTRLTDLPAWLPPENVDQLVQGSSEVLGAKTWDIELNCTPASPFDIAVYGSAAGTGPDRYDTSGSELATAVGAGDTTLLVISDDTPWTTVPAEFPFDILMGGERITVTGITGGDPTFVGVGTSATANNAGVTPGAPAGVAVGDLVLVLLSIRNSGAGVPVLPAGWLGITQGGINFQMFGRVWDGVWTMPTFTFTGGVANADTIAQSCAFRNVTMTGALSGSGLNGSAQNIATSPLAINPPGRPGVHVLQGWKQDDWTSVAPLNSEFTEIGEQVATAGDDAGQVWDFRITRSAAHPSGLTFVVTGGAAAISRFTATFLPRAPQSFTVVRSVNGIVKSHAAGADLRLWKTPRYGL